ncbi:MAG: hypothetical protein ACRDD5_17510 [Silvania sp.]|uniref:hypothetical protein n=1 Tax=Silvania sp. TaxID=3016633 RepID=UPI003EE6898F
MRVLELLSTLSTLLFVIIGFIIAGNDLVIGIKSSAPIVSAIVSFIFVAAGLFMLVLGRSATKLGQSIKPGHESFYARHCIVLNILFTITLFFGVMIIYAVMSRTGQGFAVFG